MLHPQILAYCRYLHIWSILYFLNIIYFSPLISIICVFFLHLYNYSFNSKRTGIILTDIILIICIIEKNMKIYLIENLYVFIFYLYVLLYMNIDPIKLYTINLKNDDILYKNETYFQYIKRLYNLLINLDNYDL